MFNPLCLLPVFNNLSNRQFWLGYSGGLDSHVLLHALVSLINEQAFPIRLNQLHVIHINHGWSANAAAWDAHCQQVCAALKVDYRAITINAQPGAGDSPEACARAARYAAFAEFIDPNAVLLTAHQQTDQAETLLIQLFRGAGVKGLASMPLLTPFANGWHLRPLLPYSRAALLAYAQQQQLHWIEDESNANERYTRNFLRHTILPPLKQRWPTIDAILARSAGHCAEAAQLLDEFAREDLLNVQGTQPDTLACEALLKLTAIRRKNVLRYWLQQRGVSLPGTAQLERILHDVLNSKPNACPQVSWQQHTVTRYQDNLYIIPALNLHNPAAVYPWDIKTPLVIPHIGTLTATLTTSAGVRGDIAELGTLTIRFRQYGERCQPAGRPGSHPLKKLLQEQQVPPWQRDKVPLLYCGEQLAAVVGFWVCEGFGGEKSGQEKERWLLNVI